MGPLFVVVVIFLLLFRDAKILCIPVIIIHDHEIIIWPIVGHPAMMDTFETNLLHIKTAPFTML